MYNSGGIYNNDPSSFIRLGSKTDVCYMCSIEKEDSMRKDGKSNTEIWQELKSLEGKHEYEPMFKIRYTGNDICICKEHIDKVYKELFPAEEVKKEETKKDKKESKEKSDK